MVKEEPDASGPDVSRTRRLSPFQSLSFQLTALLIALTLLLVGASVLINHLMAGNKLNGEASGYEDESANRLSLQFNQAAENAQTLAATLANLAANGARPSAAQLAELLPNASLIDSIGIWPAQERSSQLWIRDANGALQPRGEYNDPNTASYIHEKWYTPARYMPQNRCYWTPAYRDALSHRTVITCSVAIRAEGGVATVSLSTDALQSAFVKATQNETGYSLLLDDDNHILSLSQAAAAISGKNTPRNLAELSQQQPSFSPLALMLNQQQSSARSQAGNNTAAQLTALRSNTRDMSNAEAMTALAQISAAGASNVQEPQQLKIKDDPIINGDATATVITLPSTRWHLVAITSMQSGSAAANRLYQKTLIANLVAAILALVLIYIFLRHVVVNPLRRMLEQLTLSNQAGAGAPMTLDDRSHNEIGAIAQWYNEKIENLYGALSRASGAANQLSHESEERRKAQDALTLAHERSSLTLQAVSDGVITTDAMGRIEEMNPVAEQLTGQSLRNAFGKPFNEVFTAHGKNDAVMPNLAQLVVQRGARLDYTEGMRLISLTGQTHQVQLSITPIRTRQNRVTGAVIVFRRVTAEAASTAPSIEQNLPTDLHTGLPTKAALDQQMHKLLDASRGPRNHALIVIDIDHLKRINDSGGPEAGDEAIVHLGNVIKARLGKVGELFRLASARYVVLLENHNDQQAMTIAETLRITVAASPFMWESKRHTLTASFGVSQFDNRMINAAESLQRAERACKSAKYDGRNRVVVWTKAIDEAAEPLDDSVWVRRLRAGLDKNLLHLTTQLIQPAPSHQGNGNVFEVLVALEDEEGFWSSAATFIPAAERHHMMPELDCWVISRTIAYLATHSMQTASIDFVTINLSASSLDSPLVLEHIVKNFEQNPQVPARQICFEISEGAATSYMRQAQVFSETMRGIGCRMSVDHFSGRHMSDISLLRRLPLDFVKVDSMQFRNIAKDNVEQTIAESLIRIARTLQKRVIVANLEEGSRLEAWQRLGADYFQGHIIAKPTPVIFMGPN